ncbi:hypothetical protein BH09BAC1_BH09BAC1_14440 [soil metagenome]
MSKSKGKSYTKEDIIDISLPIAIISVTQALAFGFFKEFGLVSKVAISSGIMAFLLPPIYLLKARKYRIVYTAIVFVSIISIAVIGRWIRSDAAIDIKELYGTWMTENEHFILYVDINTNSTLQMRFEGFSSMRRSRTKPL